MKINQGNWNMTDQLRFDSQFMLGAWQSYVMKVIASRLTTNSQELSRRVRKMGIEQLQWQVRPGCNTIGMLLAHMAVTEAYWLSVVASNGSPAGLDLKVRDIVGIGIDDDGIPTFQRFSSLARSNLRILGCALGLLAGIFVSGLRPMAFKTVLSLSG